jgi:hypothetical protein
MCRFIQVQVKDREPSFNMWSARQAGSPVSKLLPKRKQRLSLSVVSRDWSRGRAGVITGLSTRCKKPDTNCTVKTIEASDDR